MSAAAAPTRPGVFALVSNRTEMRLSDDVHR